jgi:hypothetical protein
MSMKKWLAKNKQQRIRDKKYSRKKQAFIDCGTGVYLEIKRHKKIRRVVIDRIIQRYFEECYRPCDGRVLPREEYRQLFDHVQAYGLNAEV